MKAILISIRPQYVAKILNGNKTIEIRKRFPKDYVGWVYIYCTKVPLSKQYWLLDKDNKGNLQDPYGKVVARFWCDKVEEHKDFGMFPYGKLRYNKATCLDEEEIEDYGFVDGKGFVPLYAIHITKLEIFDEPKEISEFVPYNIKQNHYKPFPTCDFRLAHAPESFCYIEI